MPYKVILASLSSIVIIIHSSCMYNNIMLCVIIMTENGQLDVKRNSGLRVYSSKSTSGSVSLVFKVVVTGRWG